MIHTKYGYVSKEEAMIDGKLDKWCKTRNGTTDIRRRASRRNKIQPTNIATTVYHSERALRSFEKGHEVEVPKIGETKRDFVIRRRK